MTNKTIERAMKMTEYKGKDCIKNWQEAGKEVSPYYSSEYFQYHSDLLLLIEKENKHEY